MCIRDSGMTGLGKGRRVEDDEIVVVVLLVGHLGQEVEDVSLFSRHDSF